MLEALHIQNFAIIDDLTVHFSPGLNVLTGETGAGKSIVIGAMQLLLGGKGGSEQVRAGADEAVVEALFDLSDQPDLIRALEGQGLAGVEQVLLRRIISRSGKSRAYVNGQFSTLQILAELGRRWVNIYGQHEHQTLLQPDRHLDLLDQYGDLTCLRVRWGDLWTARGRLQNRIQEAEARRAEAEARRELWAFQCKEIEEADLQADEEETLEQERQVLLHAQRILEVLRRGEELLYGERGSALERIQVVLRELEELAQLAPELASIVEILAEVALQLEEGVRSFRGFMQRVEVNPQRLQEVEDRLGEIQRLKRKYKGNIAAILALGDDLRARLLELEQGEETLEGLHQQRAALEEELLAVGEELSQARKSCATRLSEGVERELRDLGIERPVFKVHFRLLEEGEVLGEQGIRSGNRGMETVEFLLSTNVGEPPRPLSRIASGGELSRIMLALKKILVEADWVPTLVFDEIDAGIGGAVAQALGEKLAHITSRHQVLCITHLPQIACYASNHFKVTKAHRGGRTLTAVESLKDGERMEEISRMLGGRVITEKTRAHARELLQNAAHRLRTLETSG